VPIVVQKRIEPTAVIVLITARYAKHQDIDGKATNANSVVTSAAHQDTQQSNVREPDATNAAARHTKAL
jgi:hypothetical protein